MKTILITGTSRGLGNALANYYCHDSIVFGVSRSDSTIDHKNYRHIQLDLTEQDSIDTIYKTILKETKRLDVLINNAAKARMNFIVTQSKSDLASIFDLNFFVPYQLIQMASRYMIRQKQGRIINLGSIAARDLIPSESTYAAAKAALLNLTQISARELGGFGITVNMISPGPFDSALTESLDQKLIHKIIEQQAIKQKVDFKDLIYVFDFFISANAKMVTGQNIYLGGP